MTQKNSVYDYEVNTDKFYGMYRGVVECRYDPDRLCRCKIRVWGVHDEEKVKTPKKGIPTHELPWAEPAYGLYQGSVSGNGMWAVPLQGSYVWVFFENGNWMQPRYFATIPGMPIDPPDPAKGFNDPMAEFPRADWLAEPDTHRLMKRDKLAETTLLVTKLPKQDIGVGIALGGAWTEHPPMYQAQYPFNSVMYSHSGIYTEIDDTENNRRYHIYHPSNSYIEIGEIGQMTIRNAEKRWDICDNMKFEHVMNDYHRKVDMNRTSLVDMDQWDEIKQNRYTKIHDTDRKDVLNDQIYHIYSSEVRHVDMNRSTYIGMFDTEWVTLSKSRYVGMFNSEYTILSQSRYVGLTDMEWVVVNQESFVGFDRTEVTAVYHVEWTGLLHEVKCEGPIHIQSAVEILLEAPIIKIKADTFLDHAAYTEIAEEFWWGGIAEGSARYAETAGIAVPGEPEPFENTVMAEPPIPPIPPEIIIIPMPPMPSSPPDIPTPPIPPEPPVLDYADIPPEPESCPPDPCIENISVIV